MPKALDLYDNEEFNACLQCAICTGSCPAARVAEGYNPRDLILRYILSSGAEDEVIDKPTVWCCTTCHICEERCPHKIRIFGLLTHIRNLAAKRGNLPAPLRQGVKLMAETGWAVPATATAARVREELGLNPLKRPDAAEIREIFRDAGLDAILELE